MIIGSVITIAWDSVGAIFTDGVGRVWLRPDGRDLSKTTYADLYGIIGDRYSDGTQGAGDFRIPDMSRAFMRGTDVPAGIDVAAASRTIDGPGNPSSDTGPVQNKAFYAHTHGWSTSAPAPNGPGSLVTREHWEPNGGSYPANSMPVSSPNYTGDAQTTSDGFIMNSSMAWMQTAPEPTAPLAPPLLVVDYVLRIA